MNHRNHADQIVAELANANCHGRYRVDRCGTDAFTRAYVCNDPTCPFRVKFSWNESHSAFECITVTGHSTCTSDSRGDTSNVTVFSIEALSAAIAFEFLDEDVNRSAQNVKLLLKKYFQEGHVPSAATVTRVKEKAIELADGDPHVLVQMIPALVDALILCGHAAEVSSEGGGGSVRHLRIKICRSR